MYNRHTDIYIDTINMQIYIDINNIYIYVYIYDIHFDFWGDRGGLPCLFLKIEKKLS